MQWTISKSYQRNKTEFIMGLTKDMRLRETTVKYRREQNSVLINNNKCEIMSLSFSSSQSVAMDGTNEVQVFQMIQVATSTTGP